MLGIPGREVSGNEKGSRLGGRGRPSGRDRAGVFGDRGAPFLGKRKRRFQDGHYTRAPGVSLRGPRRRSRSQAQGRARKGPRRPRRTCPRPSLAPEPMGAKNPLPGARRRGGLWGFRRAQGGTQGEGKGEGGRLGRRQCRAPNARHRPPDRFGRGPPCAAVGVRRGGRYWPISPPAPRSAPGSRRTPRHNPGLCLPPRRATCVSRGRCRASG